MIRGGCLFPLQHGEPFWRIRFEGCSSIFGSRPALLASLLSRPDSFLINLRLHPFALFQDFLLLGRPPLLPSPLPLFPPVRGQHGRRRNDQRPPFGRFVPGFFKFRLVRPVDWSVKTGRKKMAAILDQLARSMPTLPSVRL